MRGLGPAVCTVGDVRRLPIVVLLVAAAGLTGCSHQSAQATSSAELQAPVPTPTGDVVENLTPTGQVARQLLDAAAAKKQVPATQFRGLEASNLYYAYDFSTQTYWAGAALVPDRSSSSAQVSVQDNGAYDLFFRPRGGHWRVYEVGAAGTGSGCPIEVPSAVAVRWNWPRHSCRP